MSGAQKDPRKKQQKELLQTAAQKNKDIKTVGEEKKRGGGELSTKAGLWGGGLGLGFLCVTFLLYWAALGIGLGSFF